MTSLKEKIIKRMFTFLINKNETKEHFKNY